MLSFIEQHVSSSHTLGRADMPIVRLQLTVRSDSLVGDTKDSQRQILVELHQDKFEAFLQNLEDVQAIIEASSASNIS